MEETLKELEPHVNKNRPKEIPFKVEDPKKSGEIRAYIKCPQCGKDIKITEEIKEKFREREELLGENPIGILKIGIICECGEEF